MELTGANGRPRAAAEVRSIPPRGALIGDLSEWFAVAPAAGDYLRVLANPGVVPFALLGVPHRHWRGLNGIDLSEAATRLYAPQFVTGGGTWRTTLSLVNMEDRPAAADLQLYREDGSAAGAARRLELPARGKALVDDPRFFGLPSGEQLAGYVTLTSTGARMAGSVTFGDERREACAATLPLLGSLQRNLFFSHIASDESYYTGLAVLNPGSDQALATLEVFAPDARRLGMVRLVVSGGRKLSRLLTELLPELAGQSLRAGSMKLTSDREIAAYAVFGTRNGTALSALPAAKPAQP
jgi:hypothetical protein